MVFQFKLYSMIPLKKIDFFRSKVKRICIFQHHRPVTGDRKNGVFPVPAGVNPFVVNKIEVIAFTGIVA